MSPSYKRIRSKNRNNGRKKRCAPLKRRVKGQGRFPYTGFIFVFLVFIVGGVYLASANDRATKGYEIRTLEQKITDLQERQRDMNVAVSDLNALSRIQDESRRMGLVEARDVTYVKSKRGAVARR